MTSNLENAFSEFNDSLDKKPQQIMGVLGIPINGQRQVEVPNRNSFVYVRLRNNQNEVIQAFNEKVSPVYDLPVIVQREGTRYVILGRDSERYTDWGSYSPFLPRHGDQHSFNPETGGGGDIVWIYPRQFMPLLAMPSGSLGGPNLIINAYTLKNPDGTWKYVGNTGTQNLNIYNPATGTQAVMVLVGLDTISGNPSILVGSGSYFSNTITGAAEIVPYIPVSSNPSFIPDVAVRLITGTSSISWNNIYDVRQFLHDTPTGTGGGGGLSSVPVQDDGSPLGSATTFNFVGSNVDVSISGSVARVFVTGSVGGGSGDAGPEFGLHPSRITGSLYIPTDWHAVWAGPITIDNGASLTQPSGTRVVTL